MVQYPSRYCRFQEGPKNPLKGISMKPIVSALNAQFGVDAVGKRVLHACILRAPCNGMEVATLFMWRPDFVGRRTPKAVKFPICLRVSVKPVMRCELFFSESKCCVQSSLP